MSEVDFKAPSVTDILEWQKDVGLSDRDLGLAIIGDVSDPGAKIRAWKSGAGEPNGANILAFHYLRALTEVVNHSPSYPDEMYSVAFAALPTALQ